MTIAGEDLLEVTETGGILQASLFPDLATVAAISDVLDGYVTVAYTRTGSLGASDADNAARAYGYWQSYERRLEQLAGHGRGQIALSGQFSVGTTGDQIAELRRKADYWREVFEGLVPTQVSGPSVLPPTSTVTSTPATW